MRLVGVVQSFSYAAFVRPCLCSCIRVSDRAPVFAPPGTYRDLLIAEGSAAAGAAGGGRRAERQLVRSMSTWSVGSEDGDRQQLAVPGVGVLFAGPPSPAVAFVSRRGAGAGPAAVSNPYSPLRRLENGDGASPPPPPPPPPPPVFSAAQQHPPLTNGHCHPPPPSLLLPSAAATGAGAAGVGKERKDKLFVSKAERRRVRRKMYV